MLQNILQAVRKRESKLSKDKYNELNPHTFAVPDRHVVLFSGGVDSTATAAEIKSRGVRPLLLFVDTGCEDIGESLFCANRISEMLGLEIAVDTGLARFMAERVVGDNLYIPYRNLLFAMVAARYGDKIWMGGIKGDFSPDKSPEAFALFTRTLQESCGPNERIEFVDSPFWDMDKVSVAKRLVELEGLDVLKATLGCYHPTYEHRHCGRCLACFRRYCLFDELGIEEDFGSDPLASPAAEAYREMFETGEWHENIPLSTVERIFKEN